jgi:hypothetical protein
MTLYEQITDKMKSAMREKDKDTLSTIRLLKSAIDLNKINNKLSEITDDLVIEVASKQVKTHKESIEEFKRAGRNDLVEGLEKEIKIISEYLPEQLTKEELEKEIEKIFEIVRPEGKKDMGKIMKEANTILKGKADFKMVSEIVNNKLGA